MTRFQLVFGGWIVSLIAGGCTLIMGDPEVVRRDGNSSGQGNLAGNSSAGSSGQGGANAISGNSTSGNGGVGNSLWSNHAGQSGNAASSATNSAGTPLTAGAAGVAGQVASMVGGASNGGASGAGAAGASSGAAAGYGALTRGSAGSVASSGNSGVGGAGGSNGGSAMGGMGGVAVAGSSAVAGTSAAGAAVAGANSCPGTGGPTMVMLPQGYCIDSTEVTRGQYAAWLNTTTAATINAQDVATCGWNTSFVPHAGCMGQSYVCQGTGCEDHPQVCIDWCDAVAFCKGVGKRLCGKIGGGRNSYDRTLWSASSQWYQACSSGGRYEYPYGDTYDPTICNGLDYGAPDHVLTTVPTGSLADCQSRVPYAGVFDLSGNVLEWEDACETTARPDLDNCRVDGGSYWTVSQICSSGNLSRSYLTNAIGFRCCSQ